MLQMLNYSRKLQDSCFTATSTFIVLFFRQKAYALLFKLPKQCAAGDTSYKIKLQNQNGITTPQQHHYSFQHISP